MSVIDGYRDWRMLCMEMDIQRGGECFEVGFMYVWHVICVPRKGST